MKTDNSYLQPNQEPEKKDRSLLYMGIGLAIIIMGMGYLTFFSEDPFSVFHTQEIVVPVMDDGSKVLDQNDTMNDEEVRKSLVKFIEAFYYDQKRGYFDPPSYFSPITTTYYNYHNLTYKRLRDIHYVRMSDRKNLSQNWIVSSLDFTRQNDQLIATYWVSISYYRPSKNAQESGNVKVELIIDPNGKINSLKEIEIKNFQSMEMTDVDTLVDSIAIETPEILNPVPIPQAKYEGKVYDLGTVETVPEFHGGSKELSKYIGLNLKYPKLAKENKVQGKVYVSFVVEKNGSLSDLKIVKGIGSGCDEEAIRVLKSCPPWNSALVDGKAVRTSYLLPLTFQL